MTILTVSVPDAHGQKRWDHCRALLTHLHIPPLQRLRQPDREQGWLVWEEGKAALSHNYEKGNPTYLISR